MCPFVLLLSVLLGCLDLTSGGTLKSLQHQTSALTDGISLLPVPVASAIEDVDFRFLFDPESVDKLYEREEVRVEYNVTVCCNVTTNVSLSIAPQDEAIVEVSQNATSELLFDDLDDGNGTRMAIGSFGLKGKRLGKTDLKFRLTDRNADPTEPGSTAVGPDYRVIVLRKRRVVDDVFRYGLIALACILYIGFGCKIDLQVIKGILRKPISPAIGFGCQFILMPLLGFGISRMLSLSDELSFGLLAMSASPGGGSSNVWVSLLGGDLDLSLTMTTISTFASLGMMPLWMFLLGRLFVDPKRMSIPYLQIFRSLLTIVIPCLVGLLIKRFLPKIADPIARFTRPFSGIFVLYILSFGTYVNIYMYIIMGTVPKVIPAAILLPLLGYSIAFALALLLRRTKRSAVAISIETGVQNASIPIIMLQGNFQQPEGDIAAVMPVATSLFTQFPIMFAWIGLIIYRRHCQAKEAEEDQEQAVVAMEGKPEDKSIGNGNGNGNAVVPDTNTDVEKNGGYVNGGVVNPAAASGDNLTKF